MSLFLIITSNTYHHAETQNNADFCCLDVCVCVFVCVLKMVFRRSEVKCELCQATGWISHHSPQVTVLYSLFTSEVYIHDKKVNHRSEAAC